MKILHAILLALICTLASAADPYEANTIDSLSPKALPIYGPYWIKFNPATCDGAKLYLQGILLFGTEVGCSGSQGAAYVGYFDPVSSSVYLNATGGSSQAQAIWQLLLSLGESWVIAGNGSTALLLGPYSLSIWASKPSWAIY